MGSVIGALVGELHHLKGTVEHQLRQYAKAALSTLPASTVYATPVVMENRLTSYESTASIARRAVLVTLASAYCAWVDRSRILSARNVSTAKQAWLAPQG